MYSRLVTNFNLILPWRRWRSFVLHAANMLGQKESSFTIMDMEYQGLRLMVKFGFLIRSLSLILVHYFCRCFMYARLTFFFPVWTVLQSYTQYIPLPIGDLDSWLKTPSIYVFDCSAAGMIVSAFIEVCFTNNYLKWLNLYIYFLLNTILHFFMIKTSLFYMVTCVVIFFSTKSGVLLGPLLHQRTVFCLLPVKQMRLSHRVPNFLLMCLLPV